MIANDVNSFYNNMSCVDPGLGSSMVDLPEGYWTLCLSPKNGWVSIYEQEYSNAQIVSWVLILSIVIVTYVVRRNEQLSFESKTRRATQEIMEQGIKERERMSVN